MVRPAQLKRKLVHLALVLAMLIGGAGIIAARAQESDIAAAQAALIREFDRPEARLEVVPVVVVGDVAVAGWRQEGRGGRALLRRKSAGWIIALCAGDALRKEDSLIRMGLLPGVAAELARGVAREEARLPREHVATLDSFDGEIVIDGGGHPPARHGPAGHTPATNTGHGHGSGHAPKP